MLKRIVSMLILVIFNIILILSNINEKIGNSLIDVIPCDTSQSTYKIINKQDNILVIIINNKTKHIVYDGSDYILALTNGNGTYNIKTYSVYVDSNNNEIIDAVGDEIEIVVENFNNNVYLESTSTVDYINNVETIDKHFKDKNSLDEIFQYFCNFEYNTELSDGVKANKVRSYKTNISKVIEDKRGICVDLATAMTAVLRYKGFKTKLVYGYTNIDDSYHAWCEVLVGNNWILYDPTLKTAGYKGGRVIYEPDEIH